MSLVTEEIRAKATEVYHGNEIGQEKTKHLLNEVGLPNGILPLQDIEEVGRVEETGFVWMKQKKKIIHKFEKIGRLVAYDKEITAIADRGSGKITKLTGVKSKELFIWLTIKEISVDEPLSSGNISFKTFTALYRTFPVSAFELEEKVEMKEEEKASTAAAKEVLSTKEAAFAVNEV